MIKVIIQAGFGNQLFQYATGYALSRQLNRPLILDVSFYEYTKNLNSNAKRDVNLDKLSLDCNNWVSQPEKYFKYRYGSILSKTPFWRLFGFRSRMVWEEVKKCREYQIKLLSQVEKSSDTTLYGFWQNTNYFKDFIPELKRQFVPNYKLSPHVEDIKKRILNENNSVAVHIRRGDFVGLGWAEGDAYYKMAMDILSNEFKDSFFFIFSDDKDWTKNHFGEFENVEIIEFESETCDIDEFFLMSMCKHDIISESTFGWWAAFLNTYEKRMIIIPKTAKGELFQSLTRAVKI